MVQVEQEDDELILEVEEDEGHTYSGKLETCGKTFAFQVLGGDGDDGDDAEEPVKPTALNDVPPDMNSLLATLALEQQHRQQQGAKPSTSQQLWHSPATASEIAASKTKKGWSTNAGCWYEESSSKEACGGGLRD